jgi:hypothetical protein
VEGDRGPAPLVSAVTPRSLSVPDARVLPGSPPVGGPGCSGGGPTDTWPACRMPAGGYEDALFEQLKAPSSLHGLAEKVLLARRKCSPVRPRPTHLPTCPLPAAYVDGVRACVLQVAGAHGSAPGSPARRSWPHFSAFALVLYGLKLCCGWRCAIVEPSVRGPSLCVWCCPHAHPSPAQAFCTCSGQVVRGSGGAKNSRQNQEWPKNGVFRCACRAHIH